MAKTKQNAISKVLDDLTHIEINTIIKSGMTGTPPPDSMEELLSSLFTMYVERITLILSRADDPIDYRFDPTAVKTLNQLSAELNLLQQSMDANKQRLNEKDYIIFLRIQSFCQMIHSALSAKKFYEKEPTANTNLMDQDLTVPGNLGLENISTHMKVKLKRFHDLGSEQIVFQTRVGIDGDIITRVGEDFVKNRNQMLIDIHEQHTNLAVKYWQDMVQIVVRVVGEIFSNKS